MIDPSALTSCQRKAMRALHSRRYRNHYFTGPYRSGKTAVIPLHGVEGYLVDEAYGIGNGVYVLGGQTLGSIRRNTLSYFYDVCKHYRVRFKERGGSEPRYEVGKAAFYLFGGSNAYSYQPVRGLDVTGLYLDETSLLDEGFVRTALDRLSQPGAYSVLLSNADSPNHPFKTEYIDKRGEGDYYQEFDFWSNFYVPQRYRDELLRLPKESFYFKRYVLNEWVPAEGLVHPILSEHIRSVPLPTEVKPRGWAGFDYAIEGVCAGVLWTQPDGPGSWHQLDEYYHNGREYGVVPDEEHIRRMQARWDIVGMVVDPSARRFRNLVQAQGIPCYQGDNKLDEGIRRLNGALYGGRLTIDERCVYTLGEAAALTWNVKTEQPADRARHFCDADRYLGMRVLPAWE